MKIKKIVSTLLAMTMIGAAGIPTTMAAETENTAVTAAETTEAAPAITADTIKGIWKGSFLGYAEGGSLIERETTLNIDKCDADGKFSGLAEITSVENESYFFEGSCNFETGAFSFNGVEWRVNIEDWSMYPFNGKIDPTNNTLSGTRNKDAKSTFSFEKTSDDFISYTIDPSKISREWYGEYDGCSGDVVVKRNILISITDIAEDGKIKGYAKFTPSDKAAAEYGRIGSYYFDGTLDNRFGIIKFKGNEWIDYPALEGETEANYQMFAFKGAINGNSIIGDSECGLWTMESTSILKGDLNFDNKLGVEDLVILKKYLLNDETVFNKTLFYTADMNDDDSVDVFDLIELRKAVIKFGEKSSKS